MIHHGLVMEQLEERIVLDGAVNDVQDVQDSQGDAQHVDSLGWISAGNGWWYEDTGSGWWFNENTGWWWNQNTGWWWNESDGWWFKNENGFDFWYKGDHQYWAYETSTSLWFWWDDIVDNHWETAFSWYYDDTHSYWVLNDWNGTSYYADDAHYFYRDHWTGDVYINSSGTWINLGHQPEGTTLALDFAPGWEYSNITIIGEADGYLYFQGADSEHIGIYGYNGYSANLIYEVDTTSAYLLGSVIYNDDLYFVIAGPTPGDWDCMKFDGSALTVAFEGPSESVLPYVGTFWSFVAGDALYLPISDSGGGIDLYEYDGSSLNMVFDGNVWWQPPAYNPMNPYVMEPSGTIPFYFKSLDATTGGYDLYEYDGTSVSLVFDGNVDPRYVVRTSDGGYFFAQDAAMCWDLYKDNGLSTTKVFDGSGAALNYAFLGGDGVDLYFNMGGNLYKYDGAYTSQVLSAGQFITVTEFNSEVYFTRSDTTGLSLHQLHDGMDIVVATNVMQWLGRIDGHLCFLTQGAMGLDLHQYDGSAQTVLANNIIPNFGGMSASPVVYQNEIYFSAIDPINGLFDSYKYNGSEVTQIFHGMPPQYNLFWSDSGDLYFVGTDLIFGTELWKYDPAV
ncbi:hypothetical protein [Desulfomonile tiedjei]|uniref:Uncharacterized protein n=1 Tax=Desulfomonile tiedjei (strain ATCC 49306 / DSM 6799 / DCB-1) TaxID=706587 RepID=I4C8P3_DESTA|nr:hypothetical protein [Desulfomonile tiedjei]AFM25934.1 hypothetical protein Desti_3276 [Desulfomonile tiedjei DSM 6799]